MSKVLLFAASLLLVAGIAAAGIIDPCGAPVVYTGATPECYFACPQGDTDSFLTSGFSFAFTMLDVLGNPIPNIPGTDFWMIDCDPDILMNLVLCAGSASSNADSATNSMGKTTMSLTSMAVGGCAVGLSPVVQGFVLEKPGTCTPYCFNGTGGNAAIWVRSCDLSGDLNMGLQDVDVFARGYPPKAYNTCCDFDCNGSVGLQDLSKFAFHYGPPGHKCR